MPLLRSLELLDTRESSERERRAAHAVLLRKAHSRGFASVKVLRGEGAFRPLQGRGDFEALLAAMARKKP